MDDRSQSAPRRVGQRLGPLGVVPPLGDVLRLRDVLPRIAAALCLPLLASPPAGAVPRPQGEDERPSETTLPEALAGGEAWLEFRARYEHVEDDALGSEADAFTLRSLLGYRTAPWRELTGLLEFEAVTYLADDSFNSTTNGKTGRPVVADPEQAEVNQALLAWTGLEDTEVWIGRRRIKLDDARFVGNVGWRQNEQTFDSAGFEAGLGDRARLFYAYVQNVNRVFGDDNPLGDERSDSHFVNLAGELGPAGELVGYWYLLDNRAPAALDGFSTSTLGARLSGEWALSEGGGGASLSYLAELARQEDTGNHPGDVDAGYRRAELGLKGEAGRLRLGYELLEGSGDPGDKFSTPLATLHAFNGWADKFLVTPDDGLEDLYLGVGGTLDEVAWQVAWHQFSADTGGADYGSELDASLGFDLTETVRCGLKVARYEADELAEDTTKVWLWLSTSVL